ncbi:MAG TPA: ferritin-like domain-containing protein [Acetobacteraceae bacterium]|nr:ferritin-like domain-containing protein [Acetobacteraceae bacterium]
MNDLFLHFLQDVYYAERQILKALPKMAKAAESPKLKQAFTQHRDETQGQVDRLQQVFEQLGKRARGTTCEAIQGLIEEGEDVVNEFEQGPVRDAGLVACAQAVEHYEMARYGALIAWAKAAGQNDPVQLLQQTLDEEKRTDQLLNEIANSDINQKAAKAKAA